jgi:hypothetical protein
MANNIKFLPKSQDIKKIQVPVKEPFDIKSKMAKVMKQAMKGS